MESFGTEQTINFSVQALASAIFLVLLISYIIFSAILVYHWREYATNARVIKRTFVLYFISTAILIFSAAILWFFI